jgi:hypothetical protein
MARAIELNRQLETALVAELDEPERIRADSLPSDGPGRDTTDLR